MTPASDVEILSRLQAGDMSACADCVLEHSDELYRKACHPRETRIAQNVTALCTAISRMTDHDNVAIVWRFI